MTTRPYTVLYTQGPHDNPTDGVLEIEAVDFKDASTHALRLFGDNVDAVMLTDVWEREIGA